MRLDGKVATVTGGGGGQGRAVAVQFAREGARLVLMVLDSTGPGETRRPGEADGGIVAR